MQKDFFLVSEFHSHTTESTFQVQEDPFLSIYGCYSRKLIGIWKNSPSGILPRSPLKSLRGIFETEFLPPNTFHVLMLVVPSLV